MSKETDKTPFHIAIDGPVAAGKGTVSKLVAQLLNCLYVDTGAMYRMTAYLAKQKGVNWENEEEIVQLIHSAVMEMRNPDENEQDGRAITVLLNNEDVSWDIRTEEISVGSSIVSKLPKVRELLVEKQKKIAENKDVVMEGRDITYRVLPKANLKIFLTADAEERAKRRYDQLVAKGMDVKMEDVLREVQERDLRDTSRDADPLQITADAKMVDTTDMSIEEVAQEIVKLATAAKNKKS